MSAPRLSEIASLRAAWWAHRALCAARAGLSRGELRTVRIPGPPPLPSSAVRGVEALLRRRSHSCLEGALVRQRWLAAQGEHRDIAIGVMPPSQGFAAHAWLEGDSDPIAERFHELTRVRL